MSTLYSSMLVFIGGGLGSVLRYMLSIWWQRSETVFPFSTLVANLIAALVLAGVYGMQPKNSTLWLLISVGFCGGLSTFSTFSLETFQLFRNGELFYAWLNILLSVGFCLVIFYVLSKIYSPAV